ncbi:MAG: DMT family transporter [Clostridia bacterium]|nr:DMT family transporter [Clostridia bacterium]
MNGMNKLQANLCLLCVTLCWSTEVIIYACIPDAVSPYAINCLTSAIGAALLIAAFWKRIKEAFKTHGKGLLKACIWLGVLDAAYNTMYIYGLNDFDVSTGAFTISMTAVVLPVILLSMRQKTDLNTWISAVLVLIGIFVSYIGNVSIGQAAGFLLLLGGCIIRAVYIIEVNRFAKKYDPLSMSTIMCVLIAVMSFGFWFAGDKHTFASIEWSRQLIASIFIYSYFIVAFAQTLNFFAQRRTTPANATVVYSLEIVFSIIWGMILPASLVDPVKLSPYIVIGALFVVAGNLVVLLDFKALGKKEAV